MDTARVRSLTRDLLLAIGENPDRPGLADTPDRVARWWAEFMTHEEPRLNTTFEAITAGQLVLVSGLRVWSLCEHHLLPFWCDLAIGYRSTDKVLGLSKFARIAQVAAHRLQLQERLVTEIAGMVSEITGSPDVAVVAKGEHLCMTMRGARAPAVMTSSALTGAFQHDPALRHEFMTLAGL